MSLNILQKLIRGVIQMAKENDKKKAETCKFVDREKEHDAVESNVNAAWADIDRQESEGKVPVPSVDNVEKAKEWVEENKK